MCQLLPVRLLKMLQYIVNFPLADQIQLSLWFWHVVYSLVLSLIFVNQQYHLIHLCESKEKVLLWLNGNSLLQVRQFFLSDFTVAWRCCLYFVAFSCPNFGCWYFASGTVFKAAKCLRSKMAFWAVLAWQPVTRKWLDYIFSY